MTTNFRAFLRNLPLGTNLMGEFFAEHLFDAQTVFEAAADELTQATMLADAIEVHPNTAVRDQLIAAMDQVARLADAPGARQMHTVCASDPEVAAAFAHLESPEERALWLFVNAPTRFNEATVARLCDEGLTRDASQRWMLPARPDLHLDAAAQRAISADVSAFYLRKFGYGRDHQPYVVPRYAEGGFLLAIDLSDYACNQVRWEQGTLRRGPLMLSRALALHYQPATGVSETVAPGGADAHQALIEAFARHALKIGAGSPRIARQSYRLEALVGDLTGFDQASIGVEAPRLKRIALLDADTGLRSTFELVGRGNRASVEKVLDIVYASDNPMKRHWRIVGALIELPFYPEAGRGGERRSVLPVRFNCKGQANLHKFSEAERRMIEPLLVAWGLVESPEAERPAPAEAA